MLSLSSSPKSSPRRCCPDSAFPDTFATYMAEPLSALPQALMGLSVKPQNLSFCTVCMLLSRLDLAVWKIRLLPERDTRGSWPGLRSGNAAKITIRELVQ